MPRKTIALATAAIAVALLAGCSGGGANGGTDGGSGAGSSSAPKASSTPTQAVAAQSKTEACQAFAKEVSSATQGLQSQVTELQSDPKAAVAKLDELNSTMADSASKVTNSEVKPTTDAFAQAFSDFTAKTKTLADSKDPSALSDSGFTESLQKLQTTAQDFQTTCKP